jgi:hypothetical protein
MLPELLLISTVIPILTSPFASLIHQAMFLSSVYVAVVSEDPTSNATVGNFLPWRRGF